MADDLALTDEQRLSQAAKLEAHAKRIRDEVAGGRATLSDVVQQQADDAATFDALSRSGGLTELFLKDAPALARLPAAKRGAGGAGPMNRNRESKGAGPVTARWRAMGSGPAGKATSG